MKKMRLKKISITLIEILSLKAALLFMVLGFSMTEIQAQVANPNLVASFYNSLDGVLTDQGTVEPGSQFTYTVGVSSPDEMTAVTLSLQWDPTVLQVAGSPIDATGGVFDVTIKNELYNEQGYMTFSKIALNNTGPIGTHDYLTLVFNVNPDVEPNTNIVIEHVFELVENVIPDENISPSEIGRGDVGSILIPGPESRPGLSLLINAEGTDGGCGIESLDNAELTSSYSDGSFVGNYGITWSYIASRDENGDANGSGIDGNAIMLRRTADNSSISSSTISGGINNFSVKLYKGFTGGGNRQVELFINGISYGTSDPFDDFDMHVFVVQDINIEGDFTIELKNITSRQVIVDDISWNCVSYDCLDLNANIGDACDDGDVTTGDDTINANCQCVGIPLEQFDCPDIEANIGDACDDENDQTENDIINANCECVGTIVYDCPDMEANFGDTCDDGDDATENDIINSDCECIGTPVLVGELCGSENFDNLELSGSSYVDGSFVGNDGITWTYTQARDENGDANGSGIDGNALMLRRASDNSSVSSSTISGGISDFSVKLYKGFTGSGSRQVELLINGISYGTSDSFDDYDVHVFQVTGINISGDFTIEIMNTTSRQIIVDDITWTCGPDVVFDCPDLQANIGDDCDDNDETTENDVVGDDCVCAGTPIVVFDCPELQANIGDDCDDNDETTENDVVGDDCVCAGTPIVVFDCPDLQANIGDDCDDNDETTENDVVGDDCVCAGTPIVVFDCPELQANIGDDCDDNDETTENDVVGDDCVCAGTPIVVFDCPELQA